MKAEQGFKQERASSQDASNVQDYKPAPDGTQTYQRTFNGIDYRKYEIIDSGVNSQGNSYDTRTCDSGDGSAPQIGYHYSNADGSYYYSNPDGTKYYNNGQGGSRYTRSDGSGWEKQQFRAGEEPSITQKDVYDRQVSTSGTDSSRNAAPSSQSSGGYGSWGGSEKSGSQGQSEYGDASQSSGDWQAWGSY